MPAIRAFVGHSFRSVDKPVVDAILEVLDRVKQLRPDFDWEHALDPEPKTIDAKVLGLFQDKTLFIGICTRAERAIADERLRQLFGRRYADESAFEWKASDWLLQEIGLSIGRGLNIILLIEEGTRVPGDLQGNWERIGFNRAAPEKCYLPLLGMIANLAGKMKVPAESDLVENSAQVESVPPASPESVDVDIWQPDETWTFRTYQVAFRIVNSQEGPERASKIAAAFSASSLATDQNRASWKAFLDLTRLRSGSGVLSDVVAHATANPRNADIAVFVAEAYANFSESGEAARWYELASELSEEVVDKINYLKLGVLAALKGDKNALYASLLLKLREIEHEDAESLKARLTAELDIAEKREEDEIVIASLEKLLNLDPSDNDRRFSLAYKYSHIGRHDMAALHYERIPASLRNSFGWNNLGVAYDRLSFAIRAVDAYRRAADAGETLAASNLAKRFLDAGFVQEASNLLEEAIRKPDHDKLVDTRFAEVKEARDNEGKERNKLLGKSRATSEFYAAFGEARLAGVLDDIVGQWRTPRGTAVVNLTAAGFAATVEEPILGLMSLAIEMAGGGVPTNKIRRTLVAGSRMGRSIMVSISHIDESNNRKPKSMLEAAGDRKALVWVPSDGNELHFMEEAQGAQSVVFYSWHRTLKTA